MIIKKKRIPNGDLVVILEFEDHIEFTFKVLNPNGGFALPKADVYYIRLNHIVQAEIVNSRLVHRAVARVLLMTEKFSCHPTLRLLTREARSEGLENPFNPLAAETFMMCILRDFNPRERADREIRQGWIEFLNGSLIEKEIPG